jgi:hypothetical protein
VPNTLHFDITKITSTAKPLHTLLRSRFRPTLPRAEQERPIHANEDTAAAESVTRHLEVLYEQEKQDAIAKQLSLIWMETNEPSENTERIQSNPLRSEE